MNPTEYDIQAVLTRVGELNELIERAEDNIAQWRVERTTLNRWLNTGGGQSGGAA